MITINNNILVVLDKPRKGFAATSERRIAASGKKNTMAKYPITRRVYGAIANEKGAIEFLLRNDAGKLKIVSAEDCKIIE